LFTNDDFASIFTTVYDLQNVSGCISSQSFVVFFSTVRFVPLNYWLQICFISYFWFYRQFWASEFFKILMRRVVKMHEQTNVLTDGRTSVHNVPC